MTKPNSPQTKKSCDYLTAPQCGVMMLLVILVDILSNRLFPPPNCVGCVDAMVTEDQTTIPDHLSYTQVCPNTSNKLIALSINLL